MIEIHEINDIRQLDDHRLAWNALLAQTTGASFFQSLEWLECYWQHVATDQRLRVLIVTADGRPLGILPLVVRQEQTRVGRLRVLTYPLHDWGTFYGPIGPNPTATLLAGLRHIAHGRRDWDLVDLRWVDDDGIDRGRTERAMEQVGLGAMKQAWDQAPLVQFEGSWQDYWSTREKKFRHNVDRCVRRLGELGTVELVRYRPAGAMHDDGDPRWDLYDACVEIAGRSWQNATDDGTTLSSPGVREFFRDAHAAAARAGALDLNLLKLDGRPIAFIYNYHYDGRIYGVRKGFDPDFATPRPGMALQRMMLEDGVSRGDRLYDLGVGSHEIKRHWQTSLATSYRFTHFPMSISRTQLLRLNRLVRRRIHGDSDVACAQGT